MTPNYRRSVIKLYKMVLVFRPFQKLYQKRELRPTEVSRSGPRLIGGPALMISADLSSNPH